MNHEWMRMDPNSENKLLLKDEVFQKITGLSGVILNLKIRNWNANGSAYD